MEKIEYDLSICIDTGTEKKIEFLTNYIGQIILLNAGYIKDFGLFYGKIGSAIFLYNLDKKKDTGYFHNFANELISDINSKINLTNSSYISGSTGIAWAINYLTEHKFIDDDEVESILNSLDDFCLTKTSDGQLSADFYGICSYLLKRVSQVKNEQYDLRNMLKQERIISQIDRLTSHIFSDDYLSNNILETVLNFKSNYLIYEIDNICNSVIILNQAKTEYIYIEIVNRACNILNKKIFDYLSALSEYVLKTQDYESRYICFNCVHRLYYYYLILNCTMQPKMKFDFSNFLLETSKLFNNTNIHNFDCYQEIISYTTLFRISEIEPNNNLTKFMNQKMSVLIEELYDNSQLERFIFSNKQTLNLGLTGISGLGMILLQYVMPEIADWDKGLLIS